MQNPKPSWWLLYAIVPLMLGALVWNALYGDKGEWGDIVDVAILAGGFGLMLLWLKANQTALWVDELTRNKLRTKSGFKQRARSFRSQSQNVPHTPQRDPLPRTGVGSARGKRYWVRARETVSRDVVRISRIEVEE